MNEEQNLYIYSYNEDYSNCTYEEFHEEIVPIITNDLKRIINGIAINKEDEIYKEFQNIINLWIKKLHDITDYTIVIYLETNYISIIYEKEDSKIMLIYKRNGLEYYLIDPVNSYKYNIQNYQVFKNKIKLKENNNAILNIDKLVRKIN